MDDVRDDSLGITELEEKIEPIKKHAACEIINNRTFDVVSTEDFVAGDLIPLLLRMGFFCLSMVEILGTSFGAESNFEY